MNLAAPKARMVIVTNDLTGGAAMVCGVPALASPSERNGALPAR